jgi:hypothetical protein
MQEAATLIVTIRNRDAIRFTRLVESIRQHGDPPRVILVDYGSSEDYSRHYRDAVHSLGSGVEYEKLWTEGWPWNKCRAINHGVRLARTEYISTSDVDMLYSTDPFAFCLEQNNKRSMFHIDTYWLAADGGIETARPAGHGNPGGFQFIAREAFIETGGYDERMVYWGLEDLDWPARLEKLGYRQVWLPEPHRIYHQWHKPAEGGSLRPETASFDTMRCCLENLSKPLLAQDWGMGVERSDRPILSLLEDGAPAAEIEFSINDLMHYGNLELLLDTRKQGAFVKLRLGPRRIRRPLVSLSKAAKTMLRPITAMVGLTCVDKLNCSFDYLYALLPVLRESGLMDYYLTKDLSEAYLYWG